MKPINFAELQELARRMADEGATDREIVRRTGLSYHHVFSATRPGYAAKKARQMRERRWLAAGLGKPKRGQRREGGGAARWRGKMRVPAHAHPLVREFVAEMNLQKLLISEVATKAGLRPGTISQWRYTSTPQLGLFQAALNVLGLELVILPERAAQDEQLPASAAAIISAAYDAARAHKAVIVAEHTPGQGQARRQLVKRLDALMHAVEAAHV